MIEGFDIRLCFAESQILNMFILEIPIKGADVVSKVFRRAFPGNDNTAQIPLTESVDEDRFFSFDNNNRSKFPFGGLEDIFRKKPGVEDIFGKYFPGAKKPEKEKTIEGLDDMKEALEYVKRKQKYEGNVSGESLDKVKEDLLKTVQEITAGLNPGVGDKMKAELSEAFNAAKQGDFSKLSVFLKKIKDLSKDLKEMPKSEEYHVVPCKKPMDIAL